MRRVYEYEEVFGKPAAPVATPFDGAAAGVSIPAAPVIPAAPAAPVIPVATAPQAPAQPPVIAAPVPAVKPVYSDQEVMATAPAVEPITPPVLMVEDRPTVEEAMEGVIRDQSDHPSVNLAASLAYSNLMKAGKGVSFTPEDVADYAALEYGANPILKNIQRQALVNAATRLSGENLPLRAAMTRSTYATETFLKPKAIAGGYWNTSDPWDEQTAGRAAMEVYQGMTERGREGLAQTIQQNRPDEFVASAYMRHVENMMAEESRGKSQSTQDTIAAVNRRLIEQGLPTVNPEDFSADDTVNRGTVDEIGTALERGILQIGKGAAGNLNMLATALDKNWAPGSGDWLRSTASYGNRELDKELSFVKPSRDIGIMPDGPLDARWWLTKGAEQAPNLALFLTSGTIGAAGGKLALGAGASVRASRLVAAIPVLGTSFALESGGAYEDIYRKAIESGASREKAQDLALNYSAAVGVANSALELIPFKELFLRNPAARSRLVRAFRAGMAEGGTEGLQEAVNVIAEVAAEHGASFDKVSFTKRLTDTLTALDTQGERILSSTLVGAGTGGPLGFVDAMQQPELAKDRTDVAAQIDAMPKPVAQPAAAPEVAAPQPPENSPQPGQETISPPQPGTETPVAPEAAEGSESGPLYANDLSLYNSTKQGESTQGTYWSDEYLAETNAFGQGLKPGDVVELVSGVQYRVSENGIWLEGLDDNGNAGGPVQKIRTQTKEGKLAGREAEWTPDRGAIQTLARGRKVSSAQAPSKSTQSPQAPVAPEANPDNLPAKPSNPPPDATTVRDEQRLRELQDQETAEGLSPGEQAELEELRGNIQAAPVTPVAPAEAVPGAPAASEYSGQEFNHFTSPESAEALKSGQAFDSSKPAQHPIMSGLSEVAAEGKRFAGNRLYLSLDDARWGTSITTNAEIPARDIDPNEKIGDEDVVFYDYDNQKYQIRPGARVSTVLAPVQYRLKDDARVLVIDSAEALREIGAKYGQKYVSSDISGFFDKIAADYDAVALENMDSIANGEGSQYQKFAAMSGGDTLVILNPEAATVSKPNAQAAGEKASPKKKSTPVTLTPEQQVRADALKKRITERLTTKNPGRKGFYEASTKQYGQEAADASFAVLDKTVATIASRTGMTADQVWAHWNDTKTEGTVGPNAMLQSFDLFGQERMDPISGKTGKLGLEAGEVTESTAEPKAELTSTVAGLLNQKNAPSDPKGLYLEIVRQNKGKSAALFNNATNPMPEVTEAYNRATKGGKLFQSRKRGATEFVDAANALVSLFEKGDVSTILHEFWHVMERIPGALTAAEIKTLRVWSEREAATMFRREKGRTANKKNKTDVAALARYAAEARATGFEEYYRRGTAPKDMGNLKAIFARLSKLLRQVYAEIQKLIHLPAEVTSVFDALVGSKRTFQDQLDAQKARKQASALRAELLAWYQKETGRPLSDERDEAMRTQDGEQYSSGFSVPLTFSRKMPTEMEEALRGNFDLRRYVKVLKPGESGYGQVTGEDTLSELGSEEVIRRLKLIAGGVKGDQNRALGSIENEAMARNDLMMVAKARTYEALRNADYPIDNLEQYLADQVAELQQEIMPEQAGSEESLSRADLEEERDALVEIVEREDNPDAERRIAEIEAILGETSEDVDLPPGLNEEQIDEGTVDAKDAERPATGILADVSEAKRKRAEELKERITRKLRDNKNVGIDPTLFSDAVELGGIYVEAGARKFSAWAREIVSAVGKSIKPHLKSIYMATRHAHGMEMFKADMDSEATLDAITAEQLDAILAGEQDIQPETTDATTPESKLSDAVAEFLEGDSPLAADAFWAMADTAYGGTRAAGTYGPSDAYDALELGVNKYIRANRNEFDPSSARTAAEAKAILANLDALVDRLPSQTNRSGEKDLFQQFSTPPHYAFAAAWLANITENDVVLEPSAGTGDLAIFASNTGARVIANEISSRRAGLLRELLGEDGMVLTEDAEQIHNILPGRLAKEGESNPSAVVMNPPFSHAGTRMGDKTVIGTDLAHIDASLAVLRDGGRLVAIVGAPMRGDETQTFSRWLSKTSAKYQVRAVVTVNRSVYRKYGTTFPTRMVVIDKVSPSQSSLMVSGTFDSLGDLVDNLQGVHDDRVATKQEQDGSALPNPSGKGKTGGRSGVSVQPPTGSVGSGESSVGGGTSSAGRPGSTGNAGGGTPGVGAGDSSSVGGNGRGRGRGQTSNRPKTGRGRAGGESVQQPDSTPSITPSGVPVDSLTFENTRGEEMTGEIGESIFVPYQPSKVRIPDSKPHPASIVESAAMASVQPPDPTYRPKLPLRVVQKGLLSDVQLESVVYAGQAFETMLPAAKDETPKRRGFLVGDGTGVGKGRIISGVLLDNANRGRKKAVWISERAKLLVDARRDVSALGIDPNSIFPLGKVNVSSDIKAAEGILFTTYDTLRAKAKGQGDVPTRVSQIVKWLGEDFDGVIVFDESHNMANTVGTQGSRGRTGPSQRAVSAQELRDRLPNARILMASATAATEVSNLAYMDRLGLWGRGTAFPSREVFMSQISAGGVAAMELVARDMKAMGMYLARNLSYNDGTHEGTVTFDRIEHTLTGEQTAVYDKLAESWQLVLRNMREALEVTNNKSSQSRSNIMSQFWGTHQRFFNQIITAMQLPSVVNRIEEDLASDRSVVIQLTNTYEAAQERQLANRDADSDLEEFDLTPRDSLMEMVRGVFPIYQYQDVTDENGNTISVQVRDSEGNPVINQVALAAREALLDELGSIVVPASPLDAIVNHFGADAVAEVTGRKRRVVRMMNDESGREENTIQKRGAGTNQAEIDSFSNGKKRVLLFSEAGGTGASYHADRGIENRQKRAHYVLQAGWRADKAIQGIGRSHRSNQVMAPSIGLVSTNLKGQKRFLSTIARRLDQLGAMSKGQRQTGSSGLFSAADNLESTEAKDALQRFFMDLHHGQVDAIGIQDFEDMTGLKLRDKDGNLLDKLPPITQFLNRLLSLTVDTQNLVFDEFDTRLQERVRMAIANGTLDQGIEVYRAGRIEKQRDVVAYTHESTGAQTRYVQLAAFHENHPISWDDLQTLNPIRFVRSSHGKLYAVSASTLTTTDPRTGAISRNVRLTDQLKSHYIKEESLDNSDNWTDVSSDNAMGEWETELQQVPAESESSVHLLTGTILPIWDRIRGRTRVFRLATSSGEQMIGRVLHTKEVGPTLKALGVSAEAPQISTEDAVRRILAGEIIVELANGWTVRRSQVGREARMELIGPDFTSGAILRQDGVFTERIANKTRFFIPSGDNAAEVFEAVTKDRPVSGIQDMATGGFRHDPDKDADRDPKAGGFISLPGTGSGPQSAQVPSLTADRVASPNESIEDMFGRTDRMTTPKARLRRLLEWLGEWRGKRFIYLQHIAGKTEYAFAADRIRTMTDQAKQARGDALEAMKSIVNGNGDRQALDSAGYDLLRRKVFVEDMIVEGEKGLEEAESRGLSPDQSWINRRLPEGVTLDDLVAERKRLDDLIVTVPSVQDAYAMWSDLWSGVSADLLERGVITEEAARNKSYVRHFVLRYADEISGVPGRRKALKKPFRPYSMQRKGTSLDWSTDLLEVGLKSLADIYAANTIDDINAEIEQEHDVTREYKDAARNQNFVNLVGGQDVADRIYELRAQLRDTAGAKDSDERLQRKQWIEELEELDPTYSYRKRIAMHAAKIRKALSDGDVDLSNAPAGVQELGAINADAEELGGNWFRLVNWLASNQPETEAGMSARGLFKVIAERNEMIRTALGKRFVTFDQLAKRDGYVEWQYYRGNVMFMAKTITEDQIVRLATGLASAPGVAQEMGVPVAALRDAMVIGGKRKPVLIKPDLAAQLDDLPVSHEASHLASVTATLTQQWKSFILSVNPIRYNTRNLVGDAERVNAAGRSKAFLRIGEASKRLFTHEDPEGQAGAFDKAQRYGVINASVAYEMGSARQVMDFEHLTRIKDVGAFKKYVRLPFRAARGAKQALQDITQARENVLRYAVYLEALEDVDAYLKNGKPIRHWAGSQSMIQALAKKDKFAAAAKISRETLGDYGSFTPWENDKLRNALMPFYSWLKINTTFWPRVIANSAREGGAKAAGRTVAIRGASVGLRLGSLALRTGIAYAALAAWNYGDDDRRKKELAMPSYLRAKPHIITDGGILYMPSALSDFTEWFGLDDQAVDMGRFERGQLTWSELMTAMMKNSASASVNKVVQAITPFAKAPVTAMGLRTFPDVFEARPFAKAFDDKATEAAVLDVLGTDTKRFVDMGKGTRTVSDVFSYYFSGSTWIPMSDDDLIARLKQEYENVTLKNKSTTTGRKPGEAKAGKEREQQAIRNRMEAAEVPVPKPVGTQRSDGRPSRPARPSRPGR